ncbi:MAG: hypothetical protein JXA96_05000 [Sedimentisphaerales bacterium]|nr:hypothetical protein [Sedimentisphaerales bacterium]
MADINREIQELLVDYAGALRDGCIPSFLKSLTREEGQAIASSGDFWDASEIVRILNSTAFAEKAVTADVGLFMSRVNANIVSRKKKARGASQTRQHRNSIRKTNTRSSNKTQATE